jgi:putative SOS response-associated peptidase YedK
LPSPTGTPASRWSGGGSAGATGWRPWTGDRGTRKAPNVGDHLLYSIMTTAANGVVQPVHEKAMPAMLMTPGDVDRWLNGNLEEALELQKPAEDDQVVIVERRKAA